MVSRGRARTARRSTAIGRSTARFVAGRDRRRRRYRRAGGPHRILCGGRGWLSSGGLWPERRRAARLRRELPRLQRAPDPLGGCCSANSPEIIAAFEAAVRDGMDVINFSGGGPQADPRTDALMEAVANVVRAGVVPVISTGNDRDFFGLGTAGRPPPRRTRSASGRTANSHVFGASISVVSPAGVARIPFVPSDSIPPSWLTTNQRLVDVGSISGVNRQLCDAAPGGSLSGAIALVSRGSCPYSVKSARAREAGATGMVVVENRPGDPTFAFFSIRRWDDLRPRRRSSSCRSRRLGGRGDGSLQPRDSRGPARRGQACRRALRRPGSPPSVTL